LIRPSEFHGRTIDLLTLSACETAVGDDRAALGLAGVAIKAGSRSALATLWCVDDEASTRLISDFYSQLKVHPLHKALALQQAQIKQLRRARDPADQRFQHPYYWSPYLLIGNWQ
jgi:CHAT domain-containing protein